MATQKTQQRPLLGPASKKQEMFLNSDADITVAGGAAGSGKALRHGEKVHTPNGWVNIEDCYEGLVISDPDGGVQKVTAVYPQGEVDIYKVTFQDGSNVDTCGEHLWSYREENGDRKYVVGSTKQLKKKLEQGMIPAVPLTKPLVDNVQRACKNLSKEQAVEKKFSVLQAYFDGTGCVDASGELFCRLDTDIEVAHVRVILKSLGYTAKVEYKNKYYYLHVQGNNKHLLFSKKQVKHLIKNDQDQANKIVSIEKVGRDKATCISVSGASKLFVTTNYIVTHNTFTSLLIALKFMQHPRATGVIFRRTSTMITTPGSIWHEAVSMYSELYPKGLKIKSQTLEIIFPHGAVLKFSHMQYEQDMYAHKGGQYSLVIFDEATDFTENQIVYLLSRMRNAYVDYRPQMFLMTNPDYDSFLRLWLQDYYLDLDGIPIEERAGHKRYFLRQGDRMIWSNNRSELTDVYGENQGVTSFCFIGAKCTDNPPLMKKDPTYVSRLLSLPEVEVKRLYHGSWFARAEASGLWKREWCGVVQTSNAKAKKRVRAYDLAGSLPSPAYPDPDWTRGVLISKDDSNTYTIEDLVSIRDRFHKVEELIINTAKSDGLGTVIVLPCDPNAQAGAWARDMQRKLGEMGFSCKLVRPQQSKATRFAPFSTISQAGFVNVKEAEWYKDFCDELEKFDPEKKKQKDDIVDSVSDAVLVLNQGTVMPDLVTPGDLSMGSSKLNPMQFSFSGSQGIPVGFSSGIPSATANSVSFGLSPALPKF